MLGHVLIRVPDLEASTNFYVELLSTLSYTAKKYPEITGVGPSDGSAPIPSLWIKKHTPNDANGHAVKPTPVHLSFYTKTRKEVDEFYAAGIKLGGKDNGGPGLRTFMPNYYGMWLVPSAFLDCKVLGEC
jgi:catechol 2,3-dioxygenase-like lactoylglutathione lyase family enzyme